MLQHHSHCADMTEAKEAPDFGSRRVKAPIRAIVALSNR